MRVGSPMLAEARRRMDDTGVRVLDAELVRIDPQTAVARYGPLFETAAALGASFINVMADDPNLHRATDTFASLVEAARPYGVRPAIEAIPYACEDAPRRSRAGRNAWACWAWYWWRRRPGWLLLVGDHGQLRGPGHCLRCAEHRMVLGVEVLPPEEHPGGGGAGDGLPSLLLDGRCALPVHVDEDRQVLIPGVEFVLAADHRQPELVQDEEFLG